MEKNCGNESEIRLTSENFSVDAHFLIARRRNIMLQEMLNQNISAGSWRTTLTKSYSYLKERVTHSGVPLYGNGQGEVDRTSKADVGHWEEDWDEMEEEGGTHDSWHHLW